VSLVPQVIFAGSGVVVAAIGFYLRDDPRFGRATPFLIYLGCLLVGLAVIVTIVG
jgi:hypothetical protein